MFQFYPPHPGTINDLDKFYNDELLDILEFTFPYKWKREMILQEFDPVVSKLEAFTTLCER